MNLGFIPATVLMLIHEFCVHAAFNQCHLAGCRDGPGNLKCQSCVPGCYGQECRHACRGRCDIDGCDLTTGECLRCDPGMYGLMCDKYCPKHCRTNINDGIADCDRETGVCLEHCDSGKTGPRCQDNCPANCKGYVCTKQGGTCHLGCKHGWAGMHCNISCDNCQHGRCAGNGYCTEHCKPGFYGDFCVKKCSNCQLSGCDRRTGLCDQCLPGYHSTDCKYKCPDNCYRGRDGHQHCNRTDGHCQEGCKSGWHGTHCKTPCNSNCHLGECHSHDGHCTHPCQTGRYGSHCNSTCSGHCKSGCNRHTGVCIGGCTTGFHGHRCQHNCDENCKMCDQFSGDCVTCLDNFILQDGRCRLRKYVSRVTYVPIESTLSPVHNAIQSGACDLTSKSAIVYVIVFFLQPPLVFGTLIGYH